MPTDYIVEAYYLGSTAGNAGKDGSSAEAVQVTLSDLDNDNKIREEGASGAGDTIDGNLIITLKDDSTLEIAPNLVVSGWYIEFEDNSGDKEVYFIPTDGTIPADGTLSEDVDKNGDQIGHVSDLNPAPCFTDETRILTDEGWIAAICLRPGDRVVTRDNGLQTIRWVGHKSFSAAELIGDPTLRPVRIPAQFFGTDHAPRDLIISPQHRVALVEASSSILFGEPEVLSPAIHFCGLRGVQQIIRQTTYVHIMFEQHEIILSDGVWTESFHPGPRALKGFGKKQRDEILRLFPQLSIGTTNKVYPVSRPVLKKYETSLLLSDMGR